MTDLVLGPMLRYVDETSTTVWVETSQPCTVEVLERTARTFIVGGHHFALVLIEELQPGGSWSYEVRLDGNLVWPRPDDPPGMIRTLDPEGPMRLSYGSCRAAAPLTEPWVLPRTEDKQGSGIDSLNTFARRLQHLDVADWPHMVLLLGDQVYADSAYPATRDYIRSRRDVSKPPWEEVADFEEYTHLYREGWEDPEIRWLFSTVPIAMIFDDHDIIDDWNISASWVREMRATEWWSDRVVGGLMAYWIYQHLGNLSPDEVRASELFTSLHEVEDGYDILAEFAERADQGTTGTVGARWSYRRDLGRTRLLVLDSRNGRVLDDERTMLDDEEWSWVVDQAAGEYDHLVIASSLPVFLPRGIHGLEAWNEAVCAGAWGARAARWAERARREYDFEHWAAFQRSFTDLLGLLSDVAAGRVGRAPASVVVLSGDVHFTSLTRVHLDGAPVYQSTCSPFRYPVQPAIRRAAWFGMSMFGRAVGHLFERSAGLKHPDVWWHGLMEPSFDNDIATLTVDRRSATMLYETARRSDDGEVRLEPLIEHRLA